MSTSDRQIQLTIDGKPVTVPEHTTIYDAAARLNIDIPKLCHLESEKPVGVCRVCVVEDDKGRVAASCVREAEQGMNIFTQSEHIRHLRRTLVELLMSDHPTPCARQKQSQDCELELLAGEWNVMKSRFPARTNSRGKDTSSQIILVDHDACILCDRCIRGCTGIKDNKVLARFGKGYEAGIAFDDHQQMGISSCVSCGECMVDCPTGALTNRAALTTELPRGEVVDTNDLLDLPFFEHVSGKFLDWNKNAIVRRHYKAGEIICTEGDYGRTAFYIEEGRVQVYLSTPMKHVKSEDSTTGLFKRLKSLVPGRDEDRRPDESGRRTISIDAPVTLSYEKRLAEMGPRDLFGEMTCMNRHPRSASVRAITDCTVLEMLRNVLDIMLRNKEFKAHLELEYRKRALESHLRGVDVFDSLPPEFIEILRVNAELVPFDPGKVICEQKADADAFYLVRLGFVKVSQTYPGGELVQAYLGPGGYFGEIGLLASDGKRTATCTAVDHVEVVRIGRDIFQRMLDEYPAVRRHLEQVMEQRLRENRQRIIEADTTTVEQFVTQGLMQAESLLVLDLERCTRCDACVKACAEAHDGVTRLIREGLRFENFLVATSCRHCRDPLCMVGCPVGSIGRHEGKEVIIEDWCVGCGLCAKNCPYGNIHMHTIVEGGPQVAEVRKATSCDLCRHQAEPSCVYACPHDAAHRIDDPKEFFRQLLSVRTEAR